MTRRWSRWWFLLVVSAITVGPVDVRAIVVPLGRYDLERALALARWPHTDAERAQFHRRYIVAVNGPPIDGWAVDQVEVTTEFRRVELMAEEHVRVNDTWGRAGVREVEEDLRPWRGRVVVAMRLGLRTAGYVGPVPPVDVTLGGPGALAALDVRRTDLYGGVCSGDVGGCSLIGGLVELTFDAAAVGQTSRQVIVRWNDKALARVTIDFAALD